MPTWHYHRDNNEFVEVSSLRYKRQEVYVIVETLMPLAMQIRRTGGPEALQWTAVDVGQPGPGQVRLRQAAAGLNYIDVYHRTGSYSHPLPFVPGVEGAGTVEAVAQDTADAHQALEARATSGSTILTV